MHPVPEPKPKAGGDVRVSRYDYRQALLKANTRLISSRLWYQSVVADYAGQK